MTIRNETKNNRYRLVSKNLSRDKVMFRLQVFIETNVSKKKNILHKTRFVLNTRAQCSCLVPSSMAKYYLV